MTLRALRGSCPTTPACSGGFTLVEVLVAVLLAGTVVLALAGALLTIVRATGETADRQELQLALGNYSERLKAVAYVDCGTTSAYRTAMVATPPPPVPAGTTVDLIGVRYWNPATRTYDVTCPSPTADAGAQRLTVRVHAGGRTLQAQVVKRDGRDTP